MTDARIEAAAQLIGSVVNFECGGDWNRLSDFQKKWFRDIADAVIQEADAKAWRPIATAPRGEKIIIGHPNYAIPGYRNSDWSKPEWLDLFFSISSPSIPLFPQPTHWQPLPKPPESP